MKYSVKSNDGYMPENKDIYFFNSPKGISLMQRFLFACYTLQL